MSRGFRIFLVCLLGFCVLFGAFCIIYPLVRQNTQTEPETTVQTPVQTEPEQAEPVEEEEEEHGPSYDAQSTPLTAEQIMAQARVQDMTLEEQVYQLFITTPEELTGVRVATRAGDTTREALEAQPVGGIIYFADNLVDRQQTMEMLANTQTYTEIPLFLSVDEEGGTVSRVGSNAAMGTTRFSPMAEYGETGDAQEAYEIGSTLGSELLELGFNLDFAPVADVVTNPNNTEIGSRSFSSDPEVAAKMVGSVVSGMKEAGMISVLKHFPGHGGTETDTHDGRAVTHRTLEEMRQSEFLPFQAGIDAGAPVIMVGHLSAPELTGDNTPSDLSYAVVTEILRGELGFQGVVVTDAQNMAAITDYYDAAEAAVGALEAGVDIILMPENLTEAVNGVLSAMEAGKLSEERITESVTRILALKYEYGLMG